MRGYVNISPQSEDTMIFEKETQRRTPFHCAYNLQEIASSTPAVNNFEMDAVGKSIATPTQGASVLPMAQSRKSRASFFLFV